MSLKKAWLLLLLLLIACDNGAPATPAYPGANDAPPPSANGDAYPAPSLPTTPSDAYPAQPESAAVEAETPDGRPTPTPPLPPGADEIGDPGSGAPISAAQISAAQIEEVTIAAADGLTIHAAYATPAGAGPFPGVMLLHMLGSSRQAWADAGLLDALLQNGVAVLAVDMRGHGDTGGSQNWTLAADDLQRAWTFLSEQPQVDAGRTAVIGASIGANMALITGAEQPAVRTVVLLSPGLDYRGVTTEDALAAYGQRPLLIVASGEDGYAADSSQTLAEAAGETAVLRLFDGAGHGTAMFNREPALTPLILDWLNQHLP